MRAEVSSQQSAGGGIFAEAQRMTIGAQFFRLHTGLWLAEHPSAPFFLWAIRRDRADAEVALCAVIVRWLQRRTDLN